MKKLLNIFLLVLHTTFLQAYNDDNINSFNIKIDNFEYTKLGIACINNNFKEVNKLIDLGANISFAKQDEYYIYVALYVTIESNSLEVLTLLIKKNININQIYTEDGLTPIAFAVSLNNYRIVDILLQNKANPNGKLLSTSYHQIIPLIIAFENDNIEIARLLLKYNAITNIKNEFGQNIEELFKTKGSSWHELLKDKGKYHRTNSE